MPLSRFDAAWQRRRRIRHWWERWRWVPLFALIVAAVWAMREAGWAESEWHEVEARFPICGSAGRTATCVIDGDTLAIGSRRVRLTGYDAPELDGACEVERVRAREARAELSRWLSAGPFELEHAAGEAPVDQYDRELREARRGEHGLAEHMIALGLGRDDGWSGRSARNWCEILS